MPRDLPHPQPKLPSAAVRLAAVAAGALLWLWPAFVNRGPLLAPDAAGYLRSGAYVLAGIVHPLSQRPPSWVRSEFYALAEYALTLGKTPWPFLFAGALLLSVSVYGTLRVAIRAPLVGFLAVAAGLASVTSLPWFVSFLIPDLFCGVVCLGLYLIIFSEDLLSTRTRVCLAAMTVWAITTHPTYIGVALLVCVVLLALRIVRWRPMASRGRSLVQAFAVVLFAATIQIGLHLYLYRLPSVSGQSAPFLTARLIADGPAKSTLVKNCPALRWEICKHLYRLPSDDTEFLWQPDGIWLSSTPVQQKLLIAQEGTLARATVREHPEELLLMARHAWQELNDIDLADFAPFPLTGRMMDAITPGAGARYAASPQGRGAFPLHLLSLCIPVVVIACWIALTPLWWLAHRRGQERASGLAAVIVPAIFANAALCGAVSGVYPRYETRLIWLLPLLVFVLCAAAFRPRPV